MSEEDKKKIEWLTAEIAKLNAFFSGGASQSSAVQSSASYHVPSPKSIEMHGDIAANINFFKSTWKNYVIASGLNKRPNREQIAVLLTTIGEDCYRNYMSFPLTEAEKATPDTVLNAIEKYLVPTINKRYERAMFNLAVQHESETIDEYVLRLRNMVKSCQYICDVADCQNDMSDEFILDKLCISIRNVKLRAKLYDDKSLTLQEAINKIKVAELSDQQLKKLAEESATLASTSKFVEESENYVNKLRKSTSKFKQKNVPQMIDCKFCGDKHIRDKNECPAYGKKCYRCGDSNHLAKVCPDEKKFKRVKAIGTEKYYSSSGSSDEEQVMSIGDGNGSDLDDRVATANVEFIVGSEVVQVKCQLDTAATCNVIGKKNLSKLLDESDPMLQQSNTIIRNFGNGIIKPLGYIKLCVIRKHMSRDLRFEVVSHNHPPLISSKDSQRLGFVKICQQFASEQTKSAEEILRQFNDVFTGIGSICEPISLEIDNSVRPVIQKARRVPVSMKTNLKEEIKHLEREGIVSKVENHTEWVSNLVLIKRKDKIRICLDPVELNQALKRVNYQMPTIEEVMPELTQAKVFTTLDAYKGFWQIPLDRKSSELTTFWTPFGRYRWNRVPFGISPAPEIYQKIQHEITEGLDGVESLCDDILIYGCGKTYEEALKDHNIKLKKLLYRLRAKNLKLNKDKVKLCQSEVQFFGHLLTDKGVKPDPSKISAVTQMKRPDKVSEMLTFLGMVNYLSKFLPNLSSVSEPLRRLTHEGVEFIWTDEQTVSFETVKKLVTSAPVLQYFDGSKETVIQCDASSTGLGGVLLQDGRPVAFASRTLTSAEKNYAQIEKEALAILFSCVRFEQYIIGKVIKLQSDHKPLQTLIKKPLLEVPKRLQRMFLALQRYNFEIEFVPGSKMYIADLLSRLHLPESENSNLNVVYSFEKLDLRVSKRIERVNLVNDLPITDERVQVILNETLKDDNMRTLTYYIIHGFPKDRVKVPAEIIQYYQYQEELSTQNGLNFKGDRIVIPYKLRNDMLKRLHYSHNGIENSTKLARSTMFWPGMSKQLKNEIQRCLICQLNSSICQQKEPMISSDLPGLPFEIVSMDMMETQIKGRRRQYLVVVDHYSDFIECEEVANLEAKSIIKCCKKIFARHGIPKVVISDNGTHFKNESFRKFAQTWEFKFRTSSPRYPKSNGKAESAVKIVKQLMKKSEASKSDIYLALLNWRNTPNKIDSSPTQRLFSRRTRCLVPMMDRLLAPDVESSVKQKITSNKSQAKLYYDQGAKSLKPLFIGDSVLVRLDGAQSKVPWKEGTIMNKISERSYLVNVGEKSYRRNRIDIKEYKVPNESLINEGSSINQAVSPEAGLLNHHNASMVEDDNNDMHNTSIPELSQSSTGTSWSPQFHERPSRSVKIPTRLQDYHMY